MVPVTIRPPHPQNISTTLPTVRMVTEVSKSAAILSNSIIIKMLKSKVSVPWPPHWADNTLSSTVHQLCLSYISHVCSEGE